MQKRYALHRLSACSGSTYSGCTARKFLQLRKSIMSANTHPSQQPTRAPYYRRATDDPQIMQKAVEEAAQLRREAIDSSSQAVVALIRRAWRRWVSGLQHHHA
jgi:hypothetical protein